ncbi:BA75_00583T0 [Komagataella pastoris]|uniref:F-actin-capping protein subunit beta n=1 Tax=Komagataella pastoris TaxID=4922 RepID=A0A1B2J880_PICPA|nr:BA75_00583T0 [Komagataella pastoris]
MSQEVYEAALDLLRRLDAKNISKHLTNICKLNPDLAEDLLSSVDVPLTTKQCAESGKQYLACDYNRDGDSYRSPWSNKYYPALEDEEDAPFPSKTLREAEIFANSSFDVYRDLYFEGGISSVYLWDIDEDGNDVSKNGKIGFAGVVLIKKEIDAGKSGSWDSIHVFEVQPNESGPYATYRVTSTIILDLSAGNKEEQLLELSGNLTRQTEKELKYQDLFSHISNVGSMVEDIESKQRNMLQEVYFGKTKDVIGDLRTTKGVTSLREESEKQSELIQGMRNL